MPRKTALTLLLVMVACVWQLTNVGAQNVTPLRQGEPIERAIAQGETHLYSVRLEKDQFLQLVVDQRGVDVVVRVNGPDGKRLGEYDTPNGANGPEGVTLVAHDPGLYQVEVAPLGQAGSAASGRYEIRIVDLRAATREELAAVNGRDVAKTKGVALLDETAATIQQIRSPNTRVRAQFRVAPLLWKVDEHRARKLIDEAIIGFNEYSARALAEDE